MSAAALMFPIAQLAFVLFGLPVAFLPPFRNFSIAGRLGLSFLAGGLLYTLVATAYSLFGVPWSVASLGLPLVTVSAVASYVLSKRSAAPREKRERLSGFDMIAFAVIGISIAHVVAAFATTRASSTDYIFFWGVKALRFAQHAGIDGDLLASPRMLHLHTNYPPLVPITTAWSVLVTGSMSWRFGLVTSALWFIATIPLLFDMLEGRIGARAARIAAAIWSAALGSSLVYSMSAGNAEAPLVAYETMVVGGMLARDRMARVVLMTVGLAGLLLTKNEGMIACVIVVAAFALKLTLDREKVEWREVLAIIAAPVAAFSLWLLFEDVYHVPMSDATRETLATFSFRYADTIVRSTLQNMNAGTWGVAWIVAIAALVAGRRRIVVALPAALIGIGTVAVFVGYYFLHATDPALWITWTLPRLAQPALSALLLGGAVAFFPAAIAGDEPAAE